MAEEEILEEEIEEERTHYAEGHRRDRVKPQGPAINQLRIVDDGAHAVFSLR